VVASEERISRPSVEDPWVAKRQEHREEILEVAVVEYVRRDVEEVLLERWENR